MLSLNTFSQKESNFWYFGNYAGLNFNPGAPVSIRDGEISSNAGCASMSDRNGNLLFYTDGEKVYNKDHDIMLNGFTLKGNSKSTQSALIVPMPEDTKQYSPRKYYIFTTDVYNGTKGLRYSIVDMRLDHGKGGIESFNKDKLLLNLSAEKIASVIHNDCNSIWIVGLSTIDGEKGEFDNLFDTYHSFLLTPSGIETNSIKTTFQRKYIGVGYMKASPRGSKLAAAHTNSKVFSIYDFDNATGQLSNEVLFENSPNPYGVEFSKLGRHLFYSYPGGISQLRFGLNGALNGGSNIGGSSVTIGGALQMGSDGKIYRSLFYPRESH